MNHFVRLQLIDDGTLDVRPEAIAAIRRFDDEEYETIILTNGRSYEVAKGQISLDRLINHTSHAGVRVLV